jgi:hypothetical protein
MTQRSRLASRFPMASDVATEHKNAPVNSPAPANGARPQVRQKCVRRRAKMPRTGPPNVMGRRFSCLAGMSHLASTSTAPLASDDYAGGASSSKSKIEIAQKQRGRPCGGRPQVTLIESGDASPETLRFDSTPLRPPSSSAIRSHARRVFASKIRPSCASSRCLLLFAKFCLVLAPPNRCLFWPFALGFSIYGLTKKHQTKFLKGKKIEVAVGLAASSNHGHMA